MLFPLIFGLSVTALPTESERRAPTLISVTCQYDNYVEACLKKYTSDTNYVEIKYLPNGSLLSGKYEVMNVWYKVNQKTGTEFEMKYEGSRGLFLGVSTLVDVSSVGPVSKFDVELAFFKDEVWDSKFGKNYKFRFQ